jgi:hypothetical protein
MSLTFAFDNASLGKAKRTQEGYLRAPVTISRTGVANYGYARKVKLPEELFSAFTLDSIRGLPIVDEHPVENDNFVYVTPENFKKYAKGSVSEPKPEGDTIRALATIWDKELIEKVLSGKQEVSFGYSKEDDVNAGEFDGEKYDIIQRKIVGNHLAVTSAGRMGNRVKIELDSDFKKIKPQDHRMKYRIEEDGKLIDAEFKTYHNSEGKDIQVDSGIYNEIMVHKNALKDSKGEIDSLKEKIGELEKAKPEGDSDLKKKVESLEADAKIAEAKIETLKGKISDQKKEFDSAIQSKVQDRIDLEKNAKSVEIETDGKSDLEIKRAFISKNMKTDVNEISDVEVDAFYKASIQLHKEIEAGNAKDEDAKKTEKAEFDSSEAIQKKRDEELAEFYNKK